MINLPEFLNDVTIVKASVQVKLDGAISRGVLWQAAPDSFLLDLPGVARYLVQSGSTVTVDPAEGENYGRVERFFQMTPLAALLYQRNVLAFHAAAVADNRGAILLAGDSGAGKSSLLAALVERGWTMLADELSVVTGDTEGHLFVQPMFPEVALRPYVLEKMGISAEHLLPADANRLLLAWPDHFAEAAQPLRAVYWLGTHGQDEIEMTEVSGSARFQTLGMLLYNSHVADVLMNRVAYMSCATMVARSASIYSIKRPRGVWSVDKLADIIGNELP